MAVMTIASTPGTTMGPPADIEYAVDPVGVETTIPSAEYWPTSSPSTTTLSRTTRATPPLWTTASFSTTGSVRVLPALPTMAGCRARRDSVAYALRTIASSAQSRRCDEVLVRNPTRPRFTPRIGVFAPFKVRAPRSSVPSPPRVRRQSRPGACARVAGLGSGHNGSRLSSAYGVKRSRSAARASVARRVPRSE